MAWSLTLSLHPSELAWSSGKAATEDEAAERDIAGRAGLIPPPSLISLMVSVDVKHHVYLFTDSAASALVLSHL